MPLNLGYLQSESAPVDGVGAATARVYYDSSAGAPQPLIDGPRGYCLDLSNTTGLGFVVRLPQAQGIVLTVGQGDPAGQSLTAEQMAGLGFVSRSDCAGLSVLINE